MGDHLTRRSPTLEILRDREGAILGNIQRGNNFLDIATQQRKAVLTIQIPFDGIQDLVNI